MARAFNDLDCYSCSFGRKNGKSKDLYDAWLTTQLPDGKLFKNPARTPMIFDKYANLNYPAKVIYNPPATIIIWPLGNKTVVKCCEDDIYDPMTGFLLCCLKHYIGADDDPAKFRRFLKDFGPKPEQHDSADIDIQETCAKLNIAASRAALSIGDAAVRILDAITNAFGGNK